MVGPFVCHNAYSLYSFFLFELLEGSALCFACNTSLKLSCATCTQTRFARKWEQLRTLRYEAALLRQHVGEVLRARDDAVEAAEAAEAVSKDCCGGSSTENRPPHMQGRERRSRGAERAERQALIEELRNRILPAIPRKNLEVNLKNSFTHISFPHLEYFQTMSLRRVRFSADG